MNLSPAALLAHARSPEGRKQLRYAAVSVVFVPVGQLSIQILGWWFTRVGEGDAALAPTIRSLGPYTVASLATAALLTLPNFFANKLYVWRVASKDNLRTQIIVFKAQHRDSPPGYPNGATSGTPTEALFVAQMTKYSNAN